MQFPQTQKFEAELGVSDTHKIAYMPMNTLLIESAGRGWKNVYAALAQVNSWSGSLQSTGHPCLAYCLHRPAYLYRRLENTGQIEQATIRPREFFILPAHEGMDWLRHGSSDMLMLYLRQELIDELARAASSQAQDSVALELSLGSNDPFMEQIALSLLQAVQAPETGVSNLYVDGLVNALILHLLQRQTGSVAKADSMLVADTPALRRLPEYIEAHLGENLDIASLAREAGLSPQALTRSFREVFGLTIHQYVLTRRLERAKHLLLATDTSVVNIALETGFSSQSHLSTVFRRLVGATPGQFRQSR